MAFSRSVCRFCSASRPAEIVEETESHVALASYGALVDGWVLAFPRRHVIATADLSDPEWSALRAFTDSMASRVGQAYGVDPIVFEHGPSSAGRAAGCGVDHAHLHVVPLDVDVRAAVALLDDDIAEWNSAGNRPMRRQGHDYVWASDATGTWILHSKSAASQLIRRALALKLGNPTWDWKLDHRIDRVHRTAANLQAAPAELRAG